MRPAGDEPKIEKPLVLFDGVCNLCTWAVRFIVARDPGAKFQFASLQSPLARRLGEQYGFSTATPETIVLIESGRCYTESDAALRIARRLSGPWPVFAIAVAVPRFLRDPFYRAIARNRYRLFGKRDVCMVPDPTLKARFRDL